MIQIWVLNINATLALGLPSVCHAPANVSQCPALLHLDPNSPEAQVFYQFANSSNATSTASSPAASAPFCPNKSTSTASISESSPISDDKRTHHLIPNSQGHCTDKTTLPLLPSVEV
ncbi:hypothetical protein L1049_011242 [Liquidambar formosana]|uniref:Uncharacterized protein n=1 Tax=Liquidambar formosana TaxID=63359 RepID=A0AAP0X2L1_LIQFO